MEDVKVMKTVKLLDIRTIVLLERLKLLSEKKYTLLINGFKIY